MGPLDHAAVVGECLDRLGASWALGGSLASSLMGEPRSTNDVDIALRLEPGRVEELVDLVEGDYYAPRASLLDAARRHDSFNLLHLESSFKVDLFFLGDSLLDCWQIERRESIDVPGLDGPLWVTSAPDILLRKLWWYRLGREVSDRQWNDVLSLLRVQLPHLDLDRLHGEATALDLADLLTRALDQSSH